MGGINIVEYAGNPPTHNEIKEYYMEQNEENNENLMFELENQEILDLFRESPEANFTKFLDNYEYIEETLVKKKK